MTRAKVKESGRIGKVVRHDPTDANFMYKVEFLDDASPEADWFAKDLVEILPEGSEDSSVTEANTVQTEVARSGQTETDDCAICFEPIERGCLTPCKHLFCRECIRLSWKVQPPSWSGPCPLCRRVVSIYELQDMNSGSMLASPEVTTIYGTVYVQRGGLGIASYHFEGENDCYISYSNAPETWTLEDGNRPPTKKPFRNHSWDPKSRTFRGTIEWDPKFGGNSKWEYEIIFAADFFGVIGGHVLHDGGPGKTIFHPPWMDPLSGLNYLRWTPPPCTIFGSVYVQGPFYHHSLEGIASYHFDAEDTCYISYENAPAHWCLDDGTAPPRCKPFTNCTYDAETRVFRAVVEWEPTFQRSARWVYELVFAEDFSCISAGTFQPFDASGRAMPEMHFEDPSRQRGRSIFMSLSMHYVRKPGALMQSPDL
mmetsp:Transcript_105935/g.192743  ORF Transcript_105935/g.192743 Transcript_105935/m.192743 type:complete len:425 (-) Transcript_105935:58-1332(-)